jgi:hypothetical protein
MRSSSCTRTGVEPRLYLIDNLDVGTWVQKLPFHIGRLTSNPRTVHTSVIRPHRSNHVSSRRRKRPAAVP